MMKMRRLATDKFFCHQFQGTSCFKSIPWDAVGTNLSIKQYRYWSFVLLQVVVDGFYFCFFPHSTYGECGFCCSVAQSCLTLCNSMDCARQTSLPFTISQSLLKLMSIESVMPFNHLILSRPLLLLPSIFPASGSFPVSQLFASGGQSIGASASFLPMNIQG